jgi:hypothetical protein
MIQTLLIRYLTKAAIMALLKKLFKNKKATTAVVIVVLGVLEVKLDIGIIDAIVTIINTTAEVVE